MSSANIIQDIARTQTEMDMAREKLKELNERLDALDVFRKNCETRAQGFEALIAKRRQRIQWFGTFANTVRSAARYQNRMQELLTGNRFVSAQSAIRELLLSVGTESRKTEQELHNTKEALRFMERKLWNLEMEYQRCLEEESGNGQS